MRGGLNETTVVLSVAKDVDEVCNLRDLLVWDSTDLLEKVLFLERFVHSHIILLGASWRDAKAQPLWTRTLYF